MNWAVHLLGSHPEAHSKVQQELQEVFGNGSAPSPAAPSLTFVAPFVFPARRLLDSSRVRRVPIGGIMDVKGASPKNIENN